MDALVDRGARCVAVLDVSGVALERARARLGARAGVVRWIEADVTSEWSVAPVDIWHDRAVFHFLTDAADRARYTTRLRRTLNAGGHVVFSTFALHGPRSCSGLPTIRYSAETLARELGPEFSIVMTRDENHTTPSGTAQAFCWILFRRSRQGTS